MLLLLNATSGDSRVEVSGGKVDFAQYFTPSIAIYGLTVGCYSLPIFGLATVRELGILERVRATPLSAWVYLTAWLGAATLVGMASLALLVGVAVPVFGVHLRPEVVPAAVVTAFVSAASLAALGIAVSTFVRRSETAPAIANLTLFPLSFLSGVFFPLQGAPGWVVAIAHVFPLSHVVEAFTGCFSPYAGGSGFRGGDLAVVVAWGIAGLLVGVRRFHTEATGEARARLPLPGLGSGA